jgi:hypothetical protein
LYPKLAHAAWGDAETLKLLKRVKRQYMRESRHELADINWMTITLRSWTSHQLRIQFKKLVQTVPDRAGKPFFDILNYLLKWVIVLSLTKLPFDSMSSYCLFWLLVFADSMV